ncbi:low molecular weight protein-tyrosine-phosphatase [Haloferula sp. A504]|uniref:low molecular weight protein-tyrosine-phosphatase n=1 Tax=Haloferula sp. A504 TaxID=3373601 RepID=UPI0031CBAA70|nr:low molecular weight phosphotyrosine protein phosphatase [Verrucomicrobiaceae bacterium E54]
MTPYRILFVCMGNICRSPAAEIVFTRLAEQAGLGDRLEIDSAGTIGYHAGSPPDPRMSETLESRGYVVEGSARQVKRRDLEIHDLILCADRENLHDVRLLDPSGSTHHKIRLLTDYCREHDADHVPDPYYGARGGFEEVADLIEDASAGLIEDLLKTGAIDPSAG